MLLDVLARHCVAATFFLVGERVAPRPGVLQRLVGEPLDAVRAQLTRTSDARRRSSRSSSLSAALDRGPGAD